MEKQIFACIFVITIVLVLYTTHSIHFDSNVVSHRRPSIKKYFSSSASNNDNNNINKKPTRDYLESCRNTKNPNDKTFGLQEEPYDVLFNDNRALYEKAVKERDSEPLIVLLYNKGYSRRNEPGYPHRDFFTAGLTDQEKCPYNCLYTHDNRMLSCADVVVAHHAWGSINTNHLGWLRKQRTDVPFAWYEWESPYWSGGHEKLDGIFNLTATYDRDSELWVPYYLVLPKNSKKFAQSSSVYAVDHAKEKTKMVIVLMSNCVGYRISLIKQLQKHLEVDFFGGCNKNAGLCSKSDVAGCDKKMKQYKFYLALENSYCKDYHTEKFYDNGLLKGLVPITFMANESSEKTKKSMGIVAPPKSYINILDYPDIKSLIKYLKYLDKNNTAYNEYHAWRKDYEVVSSSPCSICQQIHENNVKKVKNHTISVAQFWNKKKKCLRFEMEMFQKYLK